MSCRDFSPGDCWQLVGAGDIIAGLLEAWLSSSGGETEATVQESVHHLSVSDPRGVVSMERGRASPQHRHFSAQCSAVGGQPSLLPT